VLDNIVDMPRRSLRRRKPDAVTLADCARDARRWELAAQFYRKALDRDPRNAPIWVQYGHAVKESGGLRDPERLAQAEAAYRMALSLDPRTADTYLQLGHAQKLQGKTEQAQAAYLRAFALDPSMSDPLAELGSLGWNNAQLSELRTLLGPDAADAADSPQHGRVDAVAPATGALFSTEREVTSDLHFNVDKVLINDGLLLEGWIFHETKEIENLSVVVLHEGISQVTRATGGRPRGDVFKDWKHEQAKRSGFLVGNLEPIELHTQDVNKISLCVKLAGVPHDLLIDLCELRMVDNAWTIQRRTETCTGAIQITQYSTGAVRSLGDALSVIAPSPRYAPRLPQPVTILVSVYQGKEYLRPFFTSLFINTQSAFSLILVDNGNEDATIRAYLRALAAAHDNATLLRVEANRGYVGAMCLAIEYAPPGQHVAVLNTDTVLPPNWLERLLGPIFADPTVASTTPFTNAGTVCSFPEIGVDNPPLLSLPTEAIDAAFAQVRGEKLQIELPSGVGFCMAHNRAAIDKIGWYDLNAFGQGYGEENDWCLRARRAGFRNILVPNLFIYHKHGGVYGDEKQALLEKSLSIIHQRYPNYGEDVAVFFNTDPVGRIRALVAFLLTCRHARGRRILLFDHGRGGGSNFFSDQLVAKLIAEGHSLSLVSWNDSALTITLMTENGSYKFKMADLREIHDLAQHVRYDDIIINQLVDIPDIVVSIEFILNLTANTNAHLTVYIHDYFWVCPSVNLLNFEGVFCDIPDLSVCKICSNKNHHFPIEASDRRDFNMTVWRSQMGRVLSAAERVVCFSHEGARRLQKVYLLAPEKVKVLPHFADYFYPPVEFRISAERVLNIAVVGGIHEAKGAGVVRRLAEAIKARGDGSVRLTVIGTIEAEVEDLGVTVTGLYSREGLSAELERHGINLVLMPSVWPETFCYVVEEVMSLGLPLAVFDIGAPAERVGLYPKGAVLPICDGEALLDALLGCARRLIWNHADNQDASIARPDVAVMSSGDRGRLGLSSSVEPFQKR
jgi:O-antigen biosynthesis protein